MARELHLLSCCVGQSTMAWGEWLRYMFPCWTAPRSPQMQTFSGEVSHCHPEPSPRSLNASDAPQSLCQDADVCKWAGEGHWPPASSRLPSSVLSWGLSAWGRTAQWEQLSFGACRAAARPEQAACLAWPNLTMWQAWMSAHSGGSAPGTACQEARCCHWKKLLHNLKS